MTSRFARLCLAGLLSTSIVATRAQTPGGQVPPPPRTPPPAQMVTPAPVAAAPVPLPTAPTSAAVKAALATDDEPVSLKLPNADIDTVLSALEIYTGKIILRPAQLPTAPGGYNLEINRPVPKSQAVLYIETILAMNNIAVIPMGADALKIVQLTMARVEAPELITGSTLQMPPSSKVASKLFQLDFLRVQEFQSMLGTMTNPLFGQAVPLANANAILITDTISNLQRIETLLESVDRPTIEGMMPKFYELKNAKASDLVTKLHGILTGTLQQQMGLGTSYSADDRTNQVIVISDPREYPVFDSLIEKLDIEAAPNTRNEVIYLKHAKAADVVQVLIRIIQGQTTAAQKSQSVRPNGPTPLQPNMPTPAPNAPGANPPTPTIFSGSASANPALEPGTTNEFSSLATVVNDDRSNAIVVSGTGDDIRLMKDLVDKLDIVLAQVRIEVVIAEVTLDDNHDSGISQLGLKLDGDRLVGFSGSGPSLSIGGADSTSTASTLASISRIGGPGSLGRSLDLTALISVNTTKRKNNTTILTVPAIVTSHGKQAIITDGETRPIITGVTSYAGTTTGATTSSQVQQTPIGTTLTVTPYIGNDGSVQLDLTQELTDVIDTVTVDGNTQYVIGNRKATSYITARSGEIIVLAGFRKKIDSRQTNRLGPIPIIGDLFGQRHKDQYHQELVLFIRPTVLTDNPAVDNAEVMKNVDQLPTRDEIKGQLDPNYQPPKQHPILDKILPH